MGVAGRRVEKPFGATSIASRIYVTSDAATIMEYPDAVIPARFLNCTSKKIGDLPVNDMLLRGLALSVAETAWHLACKERGLSVNLMGLAIFGFVAVTIVTKISPYCPSRGLKATWTSFPLSVSGLRQ